MPLFDFVCAGCDKTFEALVRSGDEPECPECGGRDLKKLLGMPAAHVKGAASAPAPPSGGFCGRGLCGQPGCGPGE